MNDITAIIITKDEEKNIVRCLESIKDLVKRSVVVDSGSTDKTVELAKKAKELHFNDPHVATVIQFYGFERFDYPFNAFEVKEMVNRYQTSKKMGTGIKTMRGSEYAKGSLIVPNIKEYAEILQKKSKA